MSLLTINQNGLYCSAGDFYIDPWRPVNSAIITHAHSDHARIGSQHYLTAESGTQLLRERLEPEASIGSVPFGQATSRNGVNVSLHPAGHILGSAQVRVEYRGEVWVVTGDYKLEREGTCEPFEQICCHTFVTESTFGLPIFRWKPQAETFSQINEWWRNNQSLARTSVLFGIRSASGGGGHLGDFARPPEETTKPERTADTSTRSQAIFCRNLSTHRPNNAIPIPARTTR